MACLQGMRATCSGTKRCAFCEVERITRSTMADEEWLALALAPTCEEEREAVNKGPDVKGILLITEDDK